MANTLAPNGFRQLRRQEGGSPTAGFDTLTIASSDPTALYTGDPVVTSATGPYVTAASSGISQIRGIFMGCEYYSPALQRKTWSASFPGSVQTSSGTNDVTAWVCTDPHFLWTAQGSTSGVIASSQVNLNIGWAYGTPTTLTGQSGAVLLSSTIGSTQTLPFRIVDLYSNYAPPGTNGTDNTSPANIVVVAANNWDRRNLTGI